MKHIFFVVLAEEQNYWRAAQRLRISTRALSMQIHQLEELLGLQLCQRRAHQAACLTTAGELLYLDAASQAALPTNLPFVKKKIQVPSCAPADIARRAYDLSMERARQGGASDPEGDWLEAERQLKAGR